MVWPMLPWSCREWGGSGEFESLVAVLDQAGTPVQAGVVQLGDRVQIKSWISRMGKCVAAIGAGRRSHVLPSLPVAKLHLIKG